MPSHVENIHLPWNHVVAHDDIFFPNTQRLTLARQAVTIMAKKQVRAFFFMLVGVDLKIRGDNHLGRSNRAHAHIRHQMARAGQPQQRRR